jgi:cytochrome b pre-mRNA-processing protein 3
MAEKMHAGGSPCQSFPYDPVRHSLTQAAMPLASFFRRNPRRSQVHAAYAAVVARAREPVFFLDGGVPDTLDGRFELIALHAFLVLNRLKADHAATADFAQELFDTMFADLDRGLREMGASDIGVGRHVKEMAKGFYGRIVAYEQGLGGDDTALCEALSRNLYGTVTPRPGAVMGIADYVRRQAAALAREEVDILLSGNINFGPLDIENE